MADQPDQPVAAPSSPLAGGCAEPPAGGPAPLPGHRTLGALFAAWVARTPHAPAVTDGRRTWSYRDLAARADRLADHLVRQGPGRTGRWRSCCPARWS